MGEMRRITICEFFDKKDGGFVSRRVRRWGLSVGSLVGDVIWESWGDGEEGECVWEGGGRFGGVVLMKRL